MKRRLLIRRDRDSRNSSVRPRSLLSEAPSLLSRHFLQGRLSPPPVKSPISQVEQLARRQALDAVLPRSPAESLYAESSDREMKTALLQAGKAAEVSTPLRLRRPKCRSDNNLFRHKAKRLAPSEPSESLSQSPGKGRKQGTTPDLSTETTAEEQESVLAEYLAEVRQLKRLKRNVSKGLLTLFPRTKVLQTHGTRRLKGAYQREQWVRAYMGRMQTVMKELDRSLERYSGS